MRFFVLNIDNIVCSQKMRVCVDTGADRSIAGKRVYWVFQENGVQMNKWNLLVVPRS